MGATSLQGWRRSDPTLEFWSWGMRQSHGEMKALLPASKGVGLGAAAGTCPQGNTQAGEPELTKGLS